MAITTAAVLAGLVVAAVPAAAAATTPTSTAVQAAPATGSLAPTVDNVGAKHGVIARLAPVYRKSPDGLGCVFLDEVCSVPSDQRSPGDPLAVDDLPPGVGLSMQCQLGAYVQVKIEVDPAVQAHAAFVRAPLLGTVERFVQQHTLSVPYWMLKRDVTQDPGFFVPGRYGLLDLSE